MKCPKCVSEGERSTMSGGLHSSTLMGTQSYYDEDGKPHRHDPNTHTQSFTCSRGHRVVVSSVLGCPSCNYGGSEKVYVDRVEFPAGLTKERV